MAKKGVAKQKVFKILLELPEKRTREVNAKGSTLEVAERRAMKFNPDAIRVKHV